MAEEEEVESEKIPSEKIDETDDSTNWFTGFEQKLGVTVSSKMALKLASERMDLQQKIKKLSDFAYSKQD